MGAMTAVMVGLGAASAVQQFTGGMAAKREAEYNASAITSEAAYNAGVYREQASMIEKQKQLKAQQDDRIMRFTMGKTVAMTAAKGLELSGSAMAVMADTMTQLEMDKAITQYNYDMQRYGVMSQAESVERRGVTLSSQYRRGGDTAMIAGITGGLTTLYQTGAYISQRSFNTSGGAKTGGKV